MLLHMYLIRNFHSTARSFRVGVPLAFVIGVAAIFYKDAKDSGYKIIPTNFKREMGMVDPRRYDFTLTKER